MIQDKTYNKIATYPFYKRVQIEKEPTDVAVTFVEY